MADLNESIKPETPTVDEIVDIFNTEEPKEEKIETPSVDLMAEEEKKDEETEEVKEDKDEKIELKTEEEQPEVEEDEILTPINRKEILKKYPNIFKEHPGLEKAFYISREYEGIVGTIKDAKELVERANEYKQVEESIFSGNLDILLAGVANADPKAFGKVVDNYLPQLGRVNPNAYYHVIGNVIKDTIRGMAHSAQQTGDDSLREAALILNKFIFQSTEFVPAQRFSGADEKLDPEKQKLIEEKQTVFTEKLQTAVETLQNNTDKIVNSNINQHIDPKGLMTDYVKRQAIRDAKEHIENSIRNDAQFKRTLDRLWEKAASENFSKSSLDKIDKAYLSKVKTVFPDAIKKSRNEALKGLGKRIASEGNDRKVTQSGGKVADKKDEKEVPKGMRTVDYFMQD